MHLCFEDDLILICGGNMQSVVALHRALEDFMLFLGLTPNVTKSNVYIAGLDIRYKEMMQNTFGFQLGDIPFICGLQASH